MINKLSSELIVLEMANNHMGDVSHGINLINAFGETCLRFPEFSFAFKLQYRDLDTFIHPSMKGRSDLKFIKRFSETRLTDGQFGELVAAMRAKNFLVMCTPFDEVSVSKIEQQDMDIIKIASCSFGDWPLLERIAQSNKPIIASTAGADIDLIDNVTAFFANRGKQFALMHCVGEYPTADEKMHVGQIGFLKARYPGVKIDLSTHEAPDNTEIIKLAVALGAEIHEKHVALETEQYSPNAYSVTPNQFHDWLEALRWAKASVGFVQAKKPKNIDEDKSLLGLRRGVFFKQNLACGETVTADDVYFAFPPEDGQITSIQWSKYSVFRLTEDVKTDDALTYSNSDKIDIRERILEIVPKVSAALKEAGVTVPDGLHLELSHHYGLENFYDTGLSMITVINRDYCKKLLILLPGQNHPEQYHKVKEESFLVLDGEVNVVIDGEGKDYKKGDLVHITPGSIHSFSSKTGCVIEEISTTHIADDSFYIDEAITNNKIRKTLVDKWKAI